MTQHDDQDFEARARQLLAEHANELPDEITQRLASARQRAVAEYAEHSEAPGRWRAFLGFWFGSGLGLGALGAAASVALALGLFVVNQGDVATMPAELMAADEAEITAAQDAELLGELEFLAWLEVSDVDAG